MYTSVYGWREEGGGRSKEGGGGREGGGEGGSERVGERERKRGGDKRWTIGTMHIPEEALSMGTGKWVNTRLPTLSPSDSLSLSCTPSPSHSLSLSLPQYSQNPNRELSCGTYSISVYYYTVASVEGMT